MSNEDFIKDPDATLDYIFDWNDWMGNGDSIIAVQFFVSAGINLVSFTNTTTNCTCWISGGAVGSVYSVTCRITTNQGRVDDRTMTLRIQQR